MDVNLKFESCLFCQNENIATSLPSPLIPNLEILCKYLKIKYPEQYHHEDKQWESLDNLFRYFIEKLNGGSISINKKSPVVNLKLCSDCLTNVYNVASLYSKLENIQKEIEEETNKIRGIILDKNDSHTITRITSQSSRYMAVMQMFKDFVKQGSLDKDLSSLQGSGPSTCGSEQYVKQEIEYTEESLHSLDYGMHDDGDDDVDDIPLEYSVVKYENEIDEQSSDPLDDADTFLDFMSVEETNDDHYDDEDWKPTETESSNSKQHRNRRTTFSGYIAENVNTRKASEFSESYTCRYCSVKLFSISSYYLHRRNVHKDKFQPLKQLSILNEGKVCKEKDVPKWKCEICNKNILSGSALVLMEHFLAHDVDISKIPSSNATSATAKFPHSIYACSNCDHKFNKEVNFDLHQLCFHESSIVELKCDICGSTKSKTRDELIHHIWTHDEELDVISCKSCPVSFSSLYKLLEHMHTHSLSKRMPCPECTMIFSSVNRLQAHCQESHLKAHVQNISKITRKKCVTKSMSRDCDTKVVQCPECPDVKVFKNRTTLENHRKIFHTSDDSKRFKCCHCGKGFVHNNTMRHHVRQMHLKIRYPCELCPKSFMSKGLLKEHVELHERAGGGPPVLSCNVCNNSFSSKGALKLHIRSQHENTEPVTCDICGQTYSNIVCLRSHKTTVHNGKKKKTYKPRRMSTNK